METLNLYSIYKSIAASVSAIDSMALQLLNLKNSKNVNLNSLKESIANAQI